MNKLFSIGVISLVLVLTLVGAVSAKEQPNGQPFKAIWEAIASLRLQLTNLQAQLQKIQLIPGPQGPQGLAGPVGLQGSKGDKGDTGLQGPVGPKGEQGLQGLTGSQGLTGLQGLKGEQGLPGLTGPQGLQGLRGDTGSLGLVGPVGPQGPQGPQGESGAQRTLGAGNIAFIIQADEVLKTDGTVWLWSNSWILNPNVPPVPIPVSNIVDFMQHSFLDGNGDVWRLNNNVWKNVGHP